MITDTCFKTLKYFSDGRLKLLQARLLRRLLNERLPRKKPIHQLLCYKYIPDIRVDIGVCIVCKDAKCFEQNEIKPVLSKNWQLNQYISQIRIQKLGKSHTGIRYVQFWHKQTIYVKNVLHYFSRTKSSISHSVPYNCHLRFFI